MMWVSKVDIEPYSSSGGKNLIEPEPDRINY